MQKFFRKISFGIVAVMVIMAILATSSPVALMAFLQESEQPSSPPIVLQIVVPEPDEHINCLVPKPSRELVFIFLNKQGAGLFSFIDGSALFDKAQTCAEGHDYFYNNDVHSNTPTITYRRLSSEHSSEG